MMSCLALVFQTRADLERERGMSEQEMNRMKHVLPAMAIFTAMAAPALAQAPDEEPVSTATVYACADIESDTDRLACYDSAVGRLKSAEESGDAVVVTRREVEEVRRDSFGFSIPSLPGLASSVFGNDEKIDEVTYPIASVQSTARGKFYVTLENGQVWQQIDNKSVYYSAKRGVENATIKSAALGSYMMKFDDGVLFRVERVK